MADRDRASRVALRLGRRDPDWGGSCASRRAALDLEPSSPNPGSVRAHRSCSTRADRAGASCACSRISTVGLMRAEDERRLASRRKRLARAPGASYSLIRNADCSVVASTTRSGRSRKFRLGSSNASLDLHGEQRSSIASSTARFAPTTLSHRSRCGTRVSTQRDRLTTSRSSPRLFRLPRPRSAAD